MAKKQFTIADEGSPEWLAEWLQRSATQPSAPGVASKLMGTPAQTGINSLVDQLATKKMEAATPSLGGPQVLPPGVAPFVPPGNLSPVEHFVENPGMYPAMVPGRTNEEVGATLAPAPPPEPFSLEPQSPEDVMNENLRIRPTEYPWQATKAPYPWDGSNSVQARYAQARAMAGSETTKPDYGPVQTPAAKAYDYYRSMGLSVGAAQAATMIAATNWKLNPKAEPWSRDGIIAKYLRSGGTAMLDDKELEALQKINDEAEKSQAKADWETRQRAARNSSDASQRASMAARGVDPNRAFSAQYPQGKPGVLSAPAPAPALAMAPVGNPPAVALPSPAPNSTKWLRGKQGDAIDRQNAAILIPEAAKYLQDNGILLMSRGLQDPANRKSFEAYKKSLGLAAGPATDADAVNPAVVAEAWMRLRGSGGKPPAGTPLVATLEPLPLDKSKRVKGATYLHPLGVPAIWDGTKLVAK